MKSYLVDTHFHLDLHQDQKIADKIEVAEVYTIAVTNTPSVFFYTQNIAKNKKYVRAALGLHPQLAEQRKKEIPLFKDLLNETKYIGEIGLDNVRSTDFEVQKKVFCQIIDWCSTSNNKILSVHSRRAEKDLIHIIGKNNPCKIILHWYSGNIKDLEVAIDYGFYFSVNDSMIQSENGRKIINKIPINRILTETDAPFGKVNSPIEMYKVVNNLTKLRSDITQDILYDNFKNILL